MQARSGPAVVHAAVVESTQAVAWQLDAEGAPDRTVVVADHQSAGRGRRGRAWTDEAGRSLLASILARPRVEPARWATYSLMTAVAVAEALRRLSGLDTRLKWPNDVLVRGRKIAGILVESRVGTEPRLVVGIGINLGQTAFPGDLADRATSVALETGHAPGRDAVLATVLDEFDVWRGRLEGQGFAEVRERWLALAETIGQRVTIDAVTGVAIDLAADGALLVDDGDTVRRVVAGEIRKKVSHAARR